MTYKITAYHEKGYDLEFGELYVTRNGKEQFVQQITEHLKKQNLYFWVSENGNIEIENDTKIVIQEYKVPTFKDSLNIEEVMFCDEGYGSTYLSYEEY